MNDKAPKTTTLKALFSKEVINTATGERLGYVDDGELNIECGEINCLFITEYCRNPFSKKKEVISFAYDDIVRIGNDIILIKSCSKQSKSEKKQL